MSDQTKLREHVLELLEGRFAHIDTESALKDFPLAEINTRVANSPHSAWQLLEHLRIAQADILDFSTNAEYKEMKWPDDYWPKAEGTSQEWEAAVSQVLADLEEMRGMVADEGNDLYHPFAHGQGQTLLREAMLLADHNAYHVGQILLLRRMLENS